MTSCVPDDPTQVEQGPPKAWAGGVPAVAVAIGRTRSKAGLVRGTRLLLDLNQPDGFDCPGCAWPEPDGDGRKRAEFCENGAKAVAEEMLDVVITDDFWRVHPISELRSRGRHWLGQQGRLGSPMWRRAGSDHYEPVTWDDALDRIAHRLRRTDPSRAAFYTSGRTSNEAAFLYQLMVRGHGSNNLPDCSNMCHEPTSIALTAAIGIGKGTVQLGDFTAADLIVVVGQNPGTNHPRMLSTLEAAKHTGARIVSINPLPEAGLLRFKNPQRPSGVIGRGTVLSDLHLPIRIGGDGALFQWLARNLLADPTRGTAVDRAFIDRFTLGFETFREALLATDPGPLAASTGLDPDVLARFADLWAASPRIIVCWAMGLTQHVGATGTIRDLVNLMLIGGHIGRAGAGLCPVRGHSNVQGDRTMGIWDKPSPAFLERLGDEFGFAPPTAAGLDVGATVDALLEGSLDVLVGLGGNFVDAVPDSDAVSAAMAGLAMSVQISTKLNRSHLFGGEEMFILPVLSRMERDDRHGRVNVVTVEDSMSRVHASRGSVQPISELCRSEVDVVADLAGRVLSGRTDSPTIDWDACRRDHDVIRAHIGRAIDGFDDFADRVRGEGFTLDSPPRRREFPTESGRSMFCAPSILEGRRNSGDLILQTLRSHDQYNTTVYGFDDRYRGLHGDRRILLIAPEDLERLGHHGGDVVDIESCVTGEPRWMRDVTLVVYPTPPGCAAAYYPEANVLVPARHRDPTSGTPGSKSLPIRLHRRAHRPPTGDVGAQPLTEPASRPFTK